MKEEYEIKNAIIDSFKLDIGDRGLLTAWLFLDYGGTSQGFGGYALYLPSSFNHHSDIGFAGHFIYRILKIAGVDEWSKLKGKTVRVKASFSKVKAIGHIVKDDWFDPEIEFEQLKDVNKQELKK